MASPRRSTLAEDRVSLANLRKSRSGIPYTLVSSTIFVRDVSKSPDSASLTTSATLDLTVAPVTAFTPSTVSSPDAEAACIRLIACLRSPWVAS